MAPADPERSQAPTEPGLRVEDVGAHYSEQA